MTDSEFQEKIDEMLDGFSPEKLKLHFIEAEEAYKKGHAFGLDYLAHFAKAIASEGILNKELTPEVIYTIEKASRAVDESKNKGKMLFWPNSVINVYPMLTLCYIIQPDWEKAVAAHSQYVEYLDLIFDIGGIPPPLDEEVEIDNILRITEQICEHYRNCGDIDQAIELMSSISRFIKSGGEETQFKYYARLSMLYYDEAMENYNCLKGEGPGGISEDIEKLHLELQNFKK